MRENAVFRLGVAVDDGEDVAAKIQSAIIREIDIITFWRRMAGFRLRQDENEAIFEATAGEKSELISFFITGFHEITFAHFSAKNQSTIYISTHKHTHMYTGTFLSVLVKVGDSCLID